MISFRRDYNQCFSDKISPDYTVLSIARADQQIFKSLIGEHPVCSSILS